jgi:hypothetical protein
VAGIDGEGRAVAVGTGVGVGIGIGVGDPVGPTATGLGAGRTGPAVTRGSTRVVVIAATASSRPTTISTARRGRRPDRSASRPADSSLTPSPPHGSADGLCHWLRAADRRKPHSYDAGTRADVTPTPTANREGGYQHEEQRQRRHCGIPVVPRYRTAKAWVDRATSSDSPQHWASGVCCVLSLELYSVATWRSWPLRGGRGGESRGAAAREPHRPRPRLSGVERCMQCVRW